MTNNFFQIPIDNEHIIMAKGGDHEETKVYCKCGHPIDAHIQVLEGDTACNAILMSKNHVIVAQCSCPGFEPE